MKSILIKAGIAILLTYSGCQLTDKGLSSPSEESLRKYKQLCRTSIKTSGLYDSTYTETTIKVLRGSSGTKYNNFTFTFLANDQTYNGSYSMTGLPQKPMVDVWYDPSDPSSYLTTDPCKQYELSKGKQYPAWYWYIGLPMLLLGISLLFGLLKTGIRAMFAFINKS